MLKEGLLKENIDGEAISWAYNREKRNNMEVINAIILGIIQGLTEFLLTRAISFFCVR